MCICYIGGVKILSTLDTYNASEARCKTANDAVVLLASIFSPPLYGKLIYLFELFVSQIVNLYLYYLIEKEVIWTEVGLDRNSSKVDIEKAISNVNNSGWENYTIDVYITAIQSLYNDETKLTLHGLRQHYVKLQDKEKNRKLLDLLDALEFDQVVIFVKSVQRCIALSQLLHELNFSVIAIYRTMVQEERLARYQQFKNIQNRILVATNLFGRGMDIERVNIVFNYDMPEDSDIYLHRVALDGRIGTKGLAITFVSEEADVTILNQIQERFVVNITELPDEIDASTNSNLTFFTYFLIAAKRIL